jgi:hypothetical protein
VIGPGTVGAGNEKSRLVRADGEAIRMSHPETIDDDDVGPELRLLSET